MTRTEMRGLFKDVFFPLIARDFRSARLNEEAMANREFHRSKQYEYVPTLGGHVSVLELDQKQPSANYA